ncbi:hypothetical protein F5141DRAFT_1210457 [Pisolithus sp. B1]|nr:hypothetical protein F5141DRAFT_1210457 [Pisolithus sp. B1]
MAKKRPEKSPFSFYHRKRNESQPESWPPSTAGSVISISDVSQPASSSGKPSRERPQFLNSLTQQVGISNVLDETRHSSLRDIGAATPPSSGHAPSRADVSITEGQPHAPDTMNVHVESDGTHRKAKATSELDQLMSDTFTAQKTMSERGLSHADGQGSTPPETTGSYLKHDRQPHREETEGITPKLQSFRLSQNGSLASSGLRIQR